MFCGFTPETFDFLWGIRMNNNREWFQQHKKQYIDTLYEPMKALGQEVFTPFADRPGSFLRVSRIYRDARMHYPEPYKESLWLSVRRDVEWWAEAPCVFFDIRPEGATYGFGFWKPKVELMERFRKQIAAEPEQFLALMEETEAATGVSVSAQCYKRPKTPEDTRLAPYYAWRYDISCTRHKDPEELFTPELGDEVRGMFQKLLPLYDYFDLLASGK